jgi:hypothetical protein
MNNTRYVERYVEDVASVCDQVEFMRGVPVALPSKTKALLRGKIREALTTYYFKGYEDGQKENVEVLPSSEASPPDIVDVRESMRQLVSTLYEQCIDTGLITATQYTQEISPKLSKLARDIERTEQRVIDEVRLIVWSTFDEYGEVMKGGAKHIEKKLNSLKK